MLLTNEIYFRKQIFIFNRNHSFDRYCIFISNIFCSYFKVGDSQFLSLELPKTESFQYKTVQNSNEIVIIKNGSIYVNNKVFDIDNVNDLEQAIFELENNGDTLILSAESDSLHVWVVTVMDLLNKYGFNEVQIRTIEK